MPDPTHNHVKSHDEKIMDEVAELRACGDMMQSSLSRIISKIEQKFPDSSLEIFGYEGFMAQNEGRTAIQKWTEIRSKSTQI